MTLLAAAPNPAAGQLVLALVLAAAGFVLLLPRPRGRWVAGGTAAVIAAAAVLGAWVHETFGEPAGDAVGEVLFILFATGAVGFGTVLVAQRNPARGAIAFAFVILSTCGLFLLLAAPFLMAATIIVYAGAIIVTFLFVLMLSQAAGPSDENDRSREPLLGSLAGFAFAGLVLFTLYATQDSLTASESSGVRPAALPAPVLTPDEKHTLAAVAERLRRLDDDAFYGDPAAVGMTHQERTQLLTRIEQSLEDVVGLSEREHGPNAEYGTIQKRLEYYRHDRQAREVLERVHEVRERNAVAMRKAEIATEGRATPAAARAEVRKLREEVLLLAGAGELPARNVGNLGLLLYADHLLAVELAGTLLLVASIGAVAIAHRR